MRLSDYLQAEKLTDQAFANLLTPAVSGASVCRWRRGIIRPTWPMLDAIKRATSGMVTADDFHAATPEAAA